MSDIRKLLDIINETTVAGSVAPMAAPIGKMQERVEETATEETNKPEVIEYGMWENSALATTSKLKKNRGKSAKVVKSIYGEDVQSEAANPKQQAAIAIAKKKEVAEGKFTINAKTGAKLDPRTGAELPPKEKPLTMKDMFRQPKSTAPKLTLDDVWMKIQSVVSNIYPDGDPIDHLAPWLEKHGIRDFKIGEILDRAAKKNGYKDLYDYWDSMGELPLSEQGVAEESEQIDEVSMEKLLKYVPNAVADLSDREIRINTGKAERNDVKKVQDRKKGLSRAAEKIGYKMAPESVAEGSEQTEETAVINMFEKLVKQGRDPIDMIAHKFGWGSYELDQLAKNLGFKNSAGWTNAVKQGKGVNEGVAEGGILKSIKRGLQGWDQNAVGPSGEKLGDPRSIVQRAKAMDTDTAKKVRAGLDAASDHSPAGLQKRVLDRKLKDVAEAAKWRDDDLEGKTWRSPDWDDGELSPSKIKIDRSGKDVDDSGDELTSRPGAWRGKADMAKRMTKKGVPTKSELGFQDNLKMRMRMKKKEGGLSGPKGPLPEDQGDSESALEESDLILNPASIGKITRGLVSHEQDRTDHEVEMAKGDLYQAGKDAVKIFELIRDISEEEGLEGWVQEKIIKAADYLTIVREYLESKQLESMDGVAPGTKMFTSEEKPGLWANIHAKRKRIKAGSGEHMRKPGSKGAPSAQDFKDAAK